MTRMKKTRRPNSTSTVLDVWIVGKEKMANTNYLQVRAVGDGQKNQKRNVNQFIMKRVQEMQIEWSTVIGVKKMMQLRYLGLL